MADLGYIEKYSNFRLDFPDFQTVTGVTFAKGVITEFKKTQDDPILVEPMVKVEIEGVGESDFIPLFYHPREGYWDAWTSSQSFDQEKGAFDMAWMSFRVDDEVVVMLQEGKPKRVIGFADGIPKEGEDIFQLTTDVTRSWRMASANPYPDGANGPDGLPLGLIKKYGWVQKNKPNAEDDHPTFYAEGKIIYEQRNLKETDHIDFPFGAITVCGFKQLECDIFLVTYKPSYKVYHNVMVIGPIIYAVEVYERTFGGEIESEIWVAGISVTLGHFLGSQIDGITGYIAFPERPGEFWASVNEFLSRSNPGKDSCQIRKVLAAPYNEELLDEELSSSNIPEELIHQKVNWEIDNPGQVICKLVSYGKDFDNPDVDLKVVPHEKKET